jgi:heme a synthase
MVASGLKEGMISVAPIKLALHLTTACLILICLVWTARALRPVHRAAGRLDVSFAVGSARVLVGLILLQITLGALVAGSKAGLTYTTWPLMDGALVPPAAVLFSKVPWLENFVDNHALVQFNHRLTAYLLLAFALWHWWRLRLSTVKGAGHIALAVCAQASVGVMTLVLAVPLWAGLMHQLLAAVILMAAVIHAEAMGRQSPALSSSHINQVV